VEGASYNLNFRATNLNTVLLQDTGKNSGWNGLQDNLIRFFSRVVPGQWTVVDIATGGGVGEGETPSPSDKARDGSHGNGGGLLVKTPHFGL